MNIIKLFFILISFNLAADNYGHLGMWSKHLNDRELNEKHNLIGIEIDNYFIHRFENSYKETTYYAGKIKRDGYCLDRLCLGYSYGLVHGYDFKKLIPVAAGVISYEKNGFGADITCLPGKKAPTFLTVCAIQFRIKFDL